MFDNSIFGSLKQTLIISRGIFPYANDMSTFSNSEILKDSEGSDPEKSLIIGLFLPILRVIPVFSRIHLGGNVTLHPHRRNSNPRKAAL
jgi:hypothetical protein